MICSHCGNQIKDGSRFCNACGASIDDIAEPIDEPIEEAAETAPATFAEHMRSERKRSRRRLTPAFIVALVLVLMAGVALAATIVYNVFFAPRIGEPDMPSSPQIEQPAETPASGPGRTWVEEQGHYEDVYETVHVPAVTHEEPVYTTVVDQEAYTEEKIGNMRMDDSPLFDTVEELDAWSVANGVSAVSPYRVTVEHPAITHEEQTGTTTVVDVPAHDEQQVVDRKWVVDVPGHWE